MSELSAVLFPHCYITEKNLKRILPIVERLMICQPWFMEKPLPVLKRDEVSLIDVLLPPVNLKPKEGFKGLLSEYMLWIRQNQDRGYAAFLGATQKTALSEDTHWEIRQMMRQMGEAPPASQENHALKWHLILHLAQAFEENLMAAHDILKQVKQQKSPLEEALGEEAQLQNMFDDLPQSETDLFVDEHHLQQVFEAWFGLFGEILPDHGILITLNRHVINYVKKIFDDKVIRLSKEAAELVSPKISSNFSDFIPYHLPHLGDDASNRRDPVLAGLAGRTIALLES
ncbi:MAG: hypothetical protein ABIN18_21740 [Pseudomonadota bacterium]